MKIKRTIVFAVLTVLLSTASTAQIRALFNHNVNNAASPVTNAVYTSNIEDTLCYYINLANTTIEIAVWDNGSSKIINALNSAYTKGVTVRYVTSSNSTNTALSGLNSNISVLERNASVSTNVMHNKFIVIDSHILITGSMNFGNGSMFDDYNNIVIIYDAPLSQNYQIEFNEMWGGNAAQPNTTNSKFGPDKTDNTQHSFTISGSPVNLYFSPTDGTTAKIVDAINSANYTLDIAMFTFINNDLGDAVVAAKNRGVTVRAIIENVSYIGSEYNNLVSNGIQAISHSSVPYDFHHKYCVIDAGQAASDPIVVTGSHNWTNSAEDDNDENTLIIHDNIIACQYFEEFSQRFQDLTTAIPELKSNTQNSVIETCNNGSIKIRSSVGWENAIIKIYNSNGQLQYNKNGIYGNNFLVDVNLLSTGLYIIQISDNKNTEVLKAKL